MQQVEESREQALQQFVIDTVYQVYKRGYVDSNSGGFHGDRAKFDRAVKAVAAALEVEIDSVEDIPETAEAFKEVLENERNSQIWELFALNGMRSVQMYEFMDRWV